MRTISFCSSPIAPDRAGGKHGPGLAVALTHAALVLVTVPEVRDVDARDGDGDEVLPLLPDHLPLLDVLAEIALDAPADDLPEAAVVLLDLQRHLGASVGRHLSLWRPRARRSRLRS